MDEQARALVTKLKEDYQSGAALLALNTLHAVLNYLGHQPTVNHDDLAELFDALKRARPSMVPLANALHQCERTLASERRKTDITASAIKAVEEVTEALEQSGKAVTRNALTLVRPGDTIITHSSSSLVLELFRALADERRPFSVICTLSGPGNEGARLAKALNQLRVPVTLITDAQMGLWMPRADLAVVGCDTWLADRHFVNKCGTYLLALAANDLGKPFWVLADHFRDSPETSQSVVLEEMPVSELAAPVGKFVTPRNFYFETIPTRLVSGRVTVQGLEPLNVIPSVPPG